MATSTATDLTRAAQLFHALSDETRLSIIEMLRDGEQCVCHLQEDLDAAQSRLSFHLRVLKDAGLVTDRKEGRWSYYSIVPEALTEVHDLAVAMQPSKVKLLARSNGRCCG
jgi:ArsR family transcriptional regulator, arsenate/arsenite/antimonite-responsive transcriptional repressor